MDIRLKKGTHQTDVIESLSGNDWFWFTLHAKNGQTLMTSEMYETKQAAVKGIKSVYRAFHCGYGEYWDCTATTKKLHRNREVVSTGKRY